MGKEDQLLKEHTKKFKYYKRKFDSTEPYFLVGVIGIITGIFWTPLFLFSILLSLGVIKTRFYWIYKAEQCLKFWDKIDN